MRKPELNRYLIKNGELSLEAFAADLALFHLDRYENKEVPMLHQAVSEAIAEAFQLGQAHGAPAEWKELAKRILGKS
jgi:hypothetical protein